MEKKMDIVISGVGGLGFLRKENNWNNLKGFCA